MWWESQHGLLLIPASLLRVDLESALILGQRWHRSERSKTEIPSLLAGIFALYAILRSGDAFKQLDDALNKARDAEKEDIGNLNAEEPLYT